MAKNKVNSKTLTGTVLMVLAALIWGTSFVAQSKGLEQVGCFTFLAFRSYLAAAALLPVSLIFYKKGKKLGDGEHGEYKSFFTKRCVIAGAVCGAIMFTGLFLQQFGIANSSVGKSGFLTTLYILVVPVVGGIFFKKKIRPVMWVFIAIALAGMFCLCVSDTGSFTFGDVMLLGCAVAFGFHIVVIGFYADSVDGVRMSFFQFIACSVLSTIAMLLFEKPDPEALKAIWFSIFYTGVMSSGAAFTLQIIAQKNLSETVTSLLMSLESVFAALSGALFLHEQLTPQQIIGCCLVFAATVLAQLPIEALFKKKSKA